jgi:hypothetical protein
MRTPDAAHADDARAADASDRTSATKPTSPPSSVSLAPNGAQLVMTQIDLGGLGQLAEVTAGSNIMLGLSMALTDTRCMMCVDQLEVGWVQVTTGKRSGCAFDEAVPNPNGVHRTITGFQIAVPTNPGLYDLRTNIGQNFSCTYNGANNWWGGGVPAAATTIVTICVR